MDWTLHCPCFPCFTVSSCQGQGGRISVFWDPLIDQNSPFFFFFQSMLLFSSMPVILYTLLLPLFFLALTSSALAGARPGQLFGSTTMELYFRVGSETYLFFLSISMISTQLKATLLIKRRSWMQQTKREVEPETLFSTTEALFSETNMLNCF